MTLSPEQVHHDPTKEQLRDIAFRTMLRQDSYQFDTVIADVRYKGYTFLIFRGRDGSLFLRYHSDTDCGRTKTFMSLGGIWSYIYDTILHEEP